VSKRRSDANLVPAYVAAASGLIGALIGAGGTALVNSANLDAQREAQKVQLATERDLAVREQRRPIYVKFDDAANTWATVQLTISECSRRTDCRYGQSDLDTARYDLQVAINEMYVYGSGKAVQVVRDVAATLPATLVGPAGAASVGAVDASGFREAITRFNEITCVDASLAPEDCSVG
jgi:hypothetical protein